MRDGKRTDSIPIPLRRMPSSSSTIAASIYSPRTSNEERSSDSIFSRSPTNSTCNSTINSSSTKDEATSPSTRPTIARFRSEITPRLKAPRRDRSRIRSFRETASQLIPSSSSTRGRSPAPPKTSSPTTSGRPIKARRSKSRERVVSPNKNVHTECGRHSNDWLFGGFSVTDSIKKLMDKK